MYQKIQYVYLLIKYTKCLSLGVAVHLSYVQNAWCYRLNPPEIYTQEFDSYLQAVSMLLNLMCGYDKFLFVWYEVTLPLHFLYCLVHVFSFAPYIDMGIQQHVNKCIDPFSTFHYLYSQNYISVNGIEQQTLCCWFWSQAVLVHSACNSKIVNYVLLASAMHFISVVLSFPNICFVFTVSSFTKGEQMIHVLNECGTHCAVFGNHDFGKNDMHSFASFFFFVVQCFVFKYMYNISFRSFGQCKSFGV